MLGLIKNKENILLLKRHPNSKTKPNKWKLPGRKVDPGKDFNKALIQEFKEETGLNIELGNLIEAIQENFTYIALVMNITTESKNPEIKINDDDID